MGWSFSGNPAWVALKGWVYQPSLPFLRPSARAETAVIQLYGAILYISTAPYKVRPRPDPPLSRKDWSVFYWCPVSVSA
jgi:hypothetical protein